MYICCGEVYKDFIYKDVRPIYQISDYGNVRNKITGKQLKPDLTKGYLRCALRTNNKGYRKILVHRMVAISFIEDLTHTKLQVNHKDGNKLNNRADNLEWVTVSENVLHAFKLGLKRPRYGTESNWCKNDEKLIDFIIERINKNFTNQQIRKDLRRKMNIHNPHVKLIYELRTRRKWKHKFKD